MPLTPRLAKRRGAWGGLASQNRSGVSSFYSFDSQQSTRLLTSILGAITDAYSYMAFGVELQSGSSTVNNLRFCGQLGYKRDRANVNSARMRILFSIDGQWDRRDPIGFFGGDANLLKYVGNSPVVRFDTSGLTCKNWKVGRINSTWQGATYTDLLSSPVNGPWWLNATRSRVHTAFVYGTGCTCTPPDKYEPGVAFHQWSSGRTRDAIDSTGKAKVTSPWEPWAPDDDPALPNSGVFPVEVVGGSAILTSGELGDPGNCCEWYFEYYACDFPGYTAVPESPLSNDPAPCHWNPPLYKSYKSGMTAVDGGYQANLIPTKYWGWRTDLKLCTGFGKGAADAHNNITTWGASAGVAWAPPTAKQTTAVFEDFPNTECSSHF